MIIAGIGAGGVYGTCVGNALKWFPDKRGLAAGITAAGFGAGSALTVAPIQAMFFLFAMAKAIVPRYRYDQLMRLGWKVFLPISLAMVIVVAGVLHFAGIAPK